nr:hypothetical protein [Tanacetum cinerariifolium]
MSTEQDIYAASSKSRPPMLNKGNYVPWSSRLLRYAKSTPNVKLIHSSIINGPYVRRMIPEPGDTNREVPMNETFHVQTDDELTKKELKWIEADDQAIQTILLGEEGQVIQRMGKNYMQQPMPNPKDITDPTTAMNMVLALIAKAFKLNYSTPTNNNQRNSSNPRNRQIAQPGMNMGQDKQMQMVGVAQNAIQNLRVQNVGNQNRLIGVPGNANQNLNGNGNLVAARVEGNAAGHNGTQTDKAPVYDSDGSAEVHDYENYYDNEIFNIFTQEGQYIELLEPIPESHQVPQHDNNVISEEAAKFVGDFKSLAKEADDSLAKHKALELEIKRLLRAVDNTRGTSTNTKFAKQSILGKPPMLGETDALSKPVTSNSIPTPQESKVVKNDKDNTRGMSTNTKFTKQSILGKPPMLGETDALSKPVTSNSISTPQESKVVKNDKVITPRMFRINPFKTSREEKHVPNTVRASARTKPITV